MQRRRNRSAAPASNTSALATVENKQLDALKQILDLQKTQSQQSLETIPDVPRIRLKRDKVYSFSRTMVLADLSVNPGFQISQAYTVNLQQSSGGSEIVALFEQYRIIQVTYHFVPTLSLGSGAVQHVPVYTWIDQDDDTVPSAPGYQSGTLRITPQGHYFERTLTPQLAQDGLASTTALTGYSSPNNMIWVDNDSPQAKYYGLKVFIPQATQQTESIIYNVRASILVQARRPI